MRYILIPTLLVIIVGTGIYILLSKTKKESPKTPERTQITWLVEKTGEDQETGAPLTRVRVNFRGEINKEYDAGTYTGDCFEIAKSQWEFLENEISGVICWWAGWGDEIGIFKEDDKLVGKHGTQSEGRPATADEPAIPNFRGDFEKLFEIKVAGWIPYEFGKTDDYAYKRPFILFYPSSSRIEKALEFSASEYSSSPPDKILFNLDNQECWMIILPPGLGIEEPVPGFSSEEKDIDIAGKKWGTMIWKVNSKVTLYEFGNKDDTNYTFSVNPETLSQCLDMYKQILSTFEFTD